MSLSKFITFSDLQILGGQGLIFWGFYQYQPWIAFVVSGAIMAIIGLYTAGATNE